MPFDPQTRILTWQCKFLLRAASLLVPGPQRPEWYQTRYQKAWHWLHFLAESGRLNQQTSIEFSRHCWSSFTDAAWHRFDQKKVMHAYNTVPRTARFCLSVVAGALLLVTVCSGFAPTIRSVFKQIPFRAPDRLAYLSMPSAFVKYDEQTLFRGVAQWPEGSKTIEMAAAYSWHPVDLAFDKTVHEVDARVSPNFFEVLGAKAELGRLFVTADNANCAGCVVISHHLWKTKFHSDPSVAGKTISVDGRSGTVIGVLQKDFVFTYPEAAIWLLPSWGPVTKNFAERTGVIVRMLPKIKLSQAKKELEHTAKEGGYNQPQLESLISRAHRGTRLYIVFTVAALLAGIALGGKQLGSAKTHKIKMGLRHQSLWWGFLLLKTLLLFALCFIGSVELSGKISVKLTGAVHPFVAPFSTWLFLVTAMIALSWSLHDQCRRCRLCLRRLSNEASVGTPGYLLLGWWGTELVCSDGHGLLHVPEMKSSWQEFDQWVSLDESWKPLFEHEEPMHIQ